ncbi:hypothetical protein Pelo_2992 [Pelomyxa schiedti]|nr:hypothetical protein Pelo_2992 [Pelomyxa schiedti]
MHLVDAPHGATAAATTTTTTATTSTTTTTSSGSGATSEPESGVTMALATDPIPPPVKATESIPPPDTTRTDDDMEPPSVVVSVPPPSLVPASTKHTDNFDEVCAIELQYGELCTDLLEMGIPQSRLLASALYLHQQHRTVNKESVCDAALSESAPQRIVEHVEKYLTQKGH